MILIHYIAGRLVIIAGFSGNMKDSFETVMTGRNVRGDGHFVSYEGFSLRWNEKSSK